MSMFNEAEKIYRALGVDVDAAFRRVAEIPVSLHCWQGDDVAGFENSGSLDGGLAVTGNYPGRARTPGELRADIDKVLSLVPGTKRLNVHAAELKQQSDVKKAEADAAYSIQEQQQRKTIEVASANADIARAERTAELKAKEVDVTKQTLDAEIRAKADAQRYAAEQEAEAELYRRTKEAEAKMIERQREAEGIRAVGEAEAEAIRLKALAEAEGIDKKAEAMKKYGEAAVIEMIMAALPEIAKNVAEPLSKVDKITMYGEGNSAKLLSDIVNGTTQVTEGISAGMGIDVKSLIMGALGGKLAADSNPPVVVVQQDKEDAE